MWMFLLVAVRFSPSLCWLQLDSMLIGRFRVSGLGPTLEVLLICLRTWPRNVEDLVWLTPVRRKPISAMSLRVFYVGRQNVIVRPSGLLSLRRSDAPQGSACGRAWPMRDDTSDIKWSMPPCAALVLISCYKSDYLYIKHRFAHNLDPLTALAMGFNAATMSYLQLCTDVNGRSYFPRYQQT